MFAQHLEQHFEFLDELPDTLYPRVVTLHYGTLQQRVKGILWWRQNLLTGVLPTIESTNWPEKSISKIIIERIVALDLVKYCHNEESLVDHVLKDICSAIERIDQLRELDAENLFDDILPSNTPTKDDFEGQNIPTNGLDPAGDASNGTMRIPESYHIDLSNATLCDEYLEQRWSGLLEKWHEIDDVFQDMGIKMGRGWDLSKGVLVSSGWKELVSYRKLFKDNPLLNEITDSIGRSLETQEDLESNGEIEKTESELETKVRVQVESKHVLNSRKPLSTRGITRSDDIARMLPQEAAYLGHPKLHMLWHVKRAECTLLSYQVEGVLSQHQHDFARFNNKLTDSKKETEGTRGPIILCVDTSASMHGKPEHIAKAIALEILRLAIGQGRGCNVIAFSGPGQVVEHTLEFSKSGLKVLIKFLQQSFSGGTEIPEPIIKALKIINEKKWNKADILLISDARFPDPGEKLMRIQKECERHNTQIQAIVVGSWSSKNLEKIANPVYRIADNDVKDLH